MHLLSTIIERMAAPLAWFVIGTAGVVGLIALVSPKLFQFLVTHGGHWIDSSRWLRWLDKRYDVDQRILPYSRLLGALVIASVLVIAFLWGGHVS